MLIHGTVTDSSGVPVESATIVFTEAPVAMPDVGALTDERGEFTLSVPAPGVYRLGCHAGGHAPGEVMVVVADADVNVRCRLPANS